MLEFVSLLKKNATLCQHSQHFQHKTWITSFPHYTCVLCLPDACLHCWQLRLSNVKWSIHVQQSVNLPHLLRKPIVKDCQPCLYCVHFARTVSRDIVVQWHLMTKDKTKENKRHKKTKWRLILFWRNIHKIHQKRPFILDFIVNLFANTTFWTLFTRLVGKNIHTLLFWLYLYNI